MLRLTMALGASLLLAGSFSRSWAEPEATTLAEATAAARAWLAAIDAEKYQQSYDAGCIAFHEKVASDKWILVLRTIRMPEGTVVSRKESGHTYKPDGFEGLDGQCMIITYDTSFSKLPSAVEQVVVKRENGKWLGAGYIVGPKPSTDSQADAPPNPTEIQTQEIHAKAPAPSPAPTPAHPPAAH